MKDTLLNVNYEIVNMNAKHLAVILKKTYSENGINISSFIEEANSPSNVPLAAYEYQNFFLLKDGEKFFLLDGFRRLLLWDVPDMEISVRVYDRKEISDKQLLQLIVNLNHTKFFGGLGAFHKRGFALLLKSIFNIDILKIQSAFEGYLSGTEEVVGVFGEKNVSYLSVISRIVTDNFTSNIKFLEKCQENNFYVGRVLGVMLFNKNKQYDAEVFISKCLEYSQFKKTLENIFSNVGVRRDNHINQLLQIYKSVFAGLDGEKIELTYLEKVAECDKIIKEIKEDKSWIKATGTQKEWEHSKFILDNLNQIEFLAVVFPIVVDKYNPTGNIGWGISGRNPIPYGKTNITFKKSEKANCYSDYQNIILQINEDKNINLFDKRANTGQKIVIFYRKKI